ncbi:MAG: archaeosortase/exosortase family protein [Armatimonadetes bacterium]|nr:archaeosortase/exosortase family protein [Armatimonadota bacterium]
MLVLIGAIALFWPTISRLPTLWGDQDGYYSHGILVPFLSALIIIRWWPTLKQNKVKPFWPALLLMIPIIGLGYISHLVVLRGVTAFLFVGTLIVGVWFVAGGRWMLLLSMPLSYLIFGLPAFERQIELYTQKFQGWNTKIAYKMLSLFGQAQMDGETTIMLDRFNLDVGVPCSGLKLFVAVTAFTVLFIYLGLMIRWDMFRVLRGEEPFSPLSESDRSTLREPKGIGRILLIVLTAIYFGALLPLSLLALVLFRTGLIRMAAAAVDSQQSSGSKMEAVEAIESGVNAEPSAAQHQTPPTTVNTGKWLLNLWRYFFQLAQVYWPVLILTWLILPLCLFINSLRIVLIGLVGNQFGNAAGHKFHDYSGYITLVVCFYLLFLVAKGLKWKV